MTVTKNRPDPRPLFINITNIDIHFTPQQFDRLCVNNPHLNLGLTPAGELIVMPLAVVDENVAISTSSDRATANITSIEKSDFGALTAEETARRVAAVERFTERKRQLWESLTPEEQVAHDRQFEILQQSIEESRK
jgi:hypothetical protein